MSLNARQTYDIDMSVTGQQNPVGGYIKALQQGQVGRTKQLPFVQGFDGTALNALFAAVATTTSQQTTDSTAGTTTTVTASGLTVAPVWWHVINASGDTPPNIQSMSYSGGTATFTVASSIASQTYQIQFV